MGSTFWVRMCLTTLGLFFGGLVCNPYSKKQTLPLSHRLELLSDVTWNNFKKELCVEFEGTTLNWGIAPNPFKYKSSFRST
jgi:hypothetical protein